MSLVNTEYVPPVTLENFDEGVIISLGGQIKDVIIDGESQRVYKVNFPGLSRFSGIDREDADWVNCYFVMPEQSLARYILPSVVIRRESPVFAPRRWLPYTTGYRIPAEGAKKIGEGYDVYKRRFVSYPFDIPYSIQLLARYEQDVLLMLQQTLKRIDPRGWVTVKVGEEFRTYDCLLDSISDISELADVVGRVRGYAVGIRVIGELDLSEDVTERAVLHPVVRITRSEEA